MELLLERPLRRLHKGLNHPLDQLHQELLQVEPLLERPLRRLLEGLNHPLDQLHQELLQVEPLLEQPLRRLLKVHSHPLQHLLLLLRQELSFVSTEVTVSPMQTVCEEINAVASNTTVNASLTLLST